VDLYFKVINSSFEMVEYSLTHLGVEARTHSVDCSEVCQWNCYFFEVDDSKKLMSLLEFRH
jgi:hypothetical protein